MSKSIIFGCKTQMQRRSMFRIASLAIAFVLVFGSFGGADLVNASYNAISNVDPLPGEVVYVEGRHSSPVTPLAREFIDASQGQQWLLNEFERILNQQGTTIDRLTQRDLDRVTSLGFQGRNIEGFIPRSIGHFRNLEYLFMSGNRLSGELPDELFALRYIKNIDLSNNLFRNEIDPRFYRLNPSLRVLRLSGNGHTGRIPIELLNTESLITLDLSDNQLTGGIPPEINRLINLSFLDISRNPSLGGVIPSTITSMTNLQILAIWGSNLTGEIPGNIGALYNLMHFDIGNNNISGEIPESVEYLTELREFTISFNRITGLIPNVFYDMERILRVHLDRNYLRGHIPSSLLYCFEERNARVTFAWNYLTGPNALAIERAAGVSVSNGNFIDGTDRGANALQFQLAIRSANGYIQVGRNAYTNLWPLLHNIIAIGRTNEAKPIRPFEEYTIFLVNLADESKISINEIGGLNVRLLEDVSYANALHLVIKIRDNTSSEFSRVMFRIGTDPPPAGGGIGGGMPGGGDTIIPDVEVPLDWLCRPYILGYPDGSVRPDRHISREEAAVMMYRIIERFETPGLASASPFIDVPRERWSSGYIDFVRVELIMQGYPDGTFRPGGSMSRNEFAVLLVNLSGRALITERPENFALTDVPDNWAAPYIFTAHQAGYIQGFPDLTFRGNQPVTRAEATRMLNGLMGRTPVRAQWADDELNPFNDLLRTHWAYYEILEASIEHVHQGGITLMPFHNRIRHQLEALLENGQAESADDEDYEGEEEDDDEYEEDAA